jgi:hypothetical protein
METSRSKGTHHINNSHSPHINLGTSTLHNVVSLFHVLDKELEWRKSTGRTEGYEAMKTSKPIVAVGPEHPLCDEELMADYFRKSLTSLFWTSL